MAKTAIRPIIILWIAPYTNKPGFVLVEYRYPRGKRKYRKYLPEDFQISVTYG